MLSAQDKAFAAIALQIGLLTPEMLKRAQALRTERGLDDPLAQVCAELNVLPARAVSKVLREVIRAAYVCTGCGSQLGYDQLATLSELACPHCSRPLRPKRRKPSGDGLTDGPAPTTAPPRPPSSREERSLFETRADGSDRHAPIEPPSLPTEGWDSKATVLEKGGAPRPTASSLIAPVASPRPAPTGSATGSAQDRPLPHPTGSGQDTAWGSNPYGSRPRGRHGSQDVPQVAAFASHQGSNQDLPVAPFDSSSPGPTTQALRAVDGASRLRLGDYELVEELGRGSNGVVYLAKRKGLERRFALKVLLDAEFADDESIKRFQLEAAIASKLNDPGIASVYDVGREGSHHYYAMEFCEGQNLHERISRGGPLPPREAAKLIGKLARTLHRAHRAGVLHRDLKPANIILAEDHPRITDFGLARDRSLQQSLTKSGDIMGTPYYMAPELIREGAKNIDHRVDIYALGVVLYECLTGERPFVAKSHMLLAQKICQEQPVPPSARNRGVPSQLDAIVLQAMDKQPRRRYVSMREFADDLELFLRGNAPRARSPETAPSAARRRKLLQVLGIVLAVALPPAIWLGWSSWTQAQHRDEIEAVLASDDPQLDALRRCLDLALTSDLPDLAERTQAALDLAQAETHLDQASSALDQPQPNLDTVDAELRQALELAGGDEGLRARHQRLQRRSQIERLVATARQLAKGERYDPAAADAYKRASLLTHDPRARGELLRERFYYLYLRGRYKDVIELGKRLSGSNDRASARARLIAALTYAEVGRGNEAKEPLKALADRFPDDAVGQLAKAQLLRLRGEPARESLELARSAARLAPDWVTALRCEAEFELLTGGAARCRELLPRAEELGPNYPRVLLLKAEFLVATGRHRDALIPVDRLIRLTEPTPSVDALFMRAKVTFDLDPKAATEATERGLAIAPDHASLRLVRGLLFLRERRRNEAQREFQAGHQASPAEFERIVNELLRSRSDRRMVLTLARGQGGAPPPRNQVRLGEVGVELKKSLEARAKAAPQAARPSLNEALQAAARGSSWPVVLQHLERATQAAPDSPVVALERARLMVGRDAYEQALKALGRAKELKAAPTPLLDRLRAEVFMRRGDIHAAKQAYRDVTRADRDGADGGCALAERLLAQLDVDGAERAARKTLRTYPDHPGSLLVLAFSSDDPDVGADALRKVYDQVGASDARVVLASNFLRMRRFLLSMGNGAVDRRDGFRLMRSTEALFSLTEAAMSRVVFLQAVLTVGVPASPWVEGWLQGHLQGALRQEPKRAEAHVLAGLLAIRRGEPAAQVLDHWKTARKLDPRVALRRWGVYLKGKYANPDLQGLLTE